MPELPEVESVRRQLEPLLVGRRIVDAWGDGHPHARQSALSDAVDGTVTAVERRGKYLRCPLIHPDRHPDERELILHLGMSGSLRVTPGPPDHPTHTTPHDRVWFALDDNAVLRFRDPRRFGRASVVPAGRYAPEIPTLATLGPEPLDATFDAFELGRRLATTRAPLKARLLDQRVVAGVGNIYADEALWRARIHPSTRRISASRVARLHDALRGVLLDAIEREGTTFRDYQMVNGASGRNAPFLDVYGRHGLPCPRCATTLRRAVVAQRGTTYCPACQRA